MGRRNPRRRQEEAKAHRRVNGVTLDAGALIALDKGDRRVVALLARAYALGAIVTIPATALAQSIRDPAKQARLARLVRQPTTNLAVLDGPDATQVGLLLRRSRTKDVVDAHVVLCAHRRGDDIVTSDPHDLQRLDPNARLVVL